MAYSPSFKIILDEMDFFKERGFLRKALLLIQAAALTAFMVLVFLYSYA